MKPKTLDVATDYRLALLWLMERIETSHIRRAKAAFEQQFGDLIPAHHLRTNKNGRVKWEDYVEWSRFELVRVGLMGSGGRGVWTITLAGKAWLRDNPDAHAGDLAAFTKQGGAEAESGFRWRGEHHDITKRALFSRARQRLQSGPPREALRFRTWAVFVGDQPVSVKWLFALATGADHNEFDSPTARRALSQIGVETQRVGKGEKMADVPAQSPRRASRVERRDEFFAQVAEHLSSGMRDQAHRGEIKSVPGRNWLNVDYAIMG